MLEHYRQIFLACLCARACVIAAYAQEKRPDATDRLKSVQVATHCLSLATNKAVTVWCCVPQNFDPAERGRAWRVLVIFGGAQREREE